MSYGHGIRRIGHDHYRLTWTVDYRYPTSRLRFPRAFTRDTDRAGAERFATRWKAKMPREPANPDRDQGKPCPYWPRCSCIVRGYVNRDEIGQTGPEFGCGRKPKGSHR